MSTASEILTKLDQLRARHAQVVTAEAVANQQYQQAQAAKAKAADELRTLGIDPDHAATEVPALLTKLEQDIEVMSKELDAAMESYAAVGTAFAQIGQ